MSEQVERRLLEVLGNPTESPYGNPIPALEAIGGVPAEEFLDGVERLSELAAELPSGALSVRIRRLAEPVQFEPELLEQLRAAGVLPGASARVCAVGIDYVGVSVEGFGEGLELPVEVAQHIYVSV